MRITKSIKEDMFNDLKHNIIFDIDNLRKNYLVSGYLDEEARSKYKYDIAMLSIQLHMKIQDFTEYLVRVVIDYDDVKYWVRFFVNNNNGDFDVRPYHAFSKIK